MSTPAARLAATVPAFPVDPGADVAVTGVSDDTRGTGPGDLFVARGAWSAEATERLARAAAAGAAAAVLPADADAEAATRAAPEVVLFLAGPGTAVDQAAAGRVADAFFEHPADGLALIGVTGTNGKTTVATLLQHLLGRLGTRCGLLGTVAVDTGGGPRPATLTTPGAVELRRLLAEARGHGCSAVAMEVSSHALDQGRVAGLSFAAGVFTNLTQDHLDYHGTMEAYATAKARLFEQLEPAGVAIVNAEDPAAARMAASVLADQRIPTRLGPGADAAHPGASAEILRLAATSAKARFRGAFGCFEATLGVGGRHNVSNALQAVAAAHAVAGRLAPGAATAEALAEAIASAPPVPGRLEAVPPPDLPPDLTATGLGHPSVLVDYAHTPDALERVLAALRPVTPGRLVCVYGCGGDRDRVKRPLMTRAALEGADAVVLTSDNPRTEDPQRILDDASAEVAASDRGRLRVVADRRAALRAAVADAATGDTVLIAGKGHEPYQLVSDGAGGVRSLPFDDRVEAAEALRLRSAASR